MEYRQATAQDQHQIAALHAQSWRETYRGMLPDIFLDKEVLNNRKALWNERFCQPKSNQLVMVAHKNNHLCGFICVYGNEDAKRGTFIDNLHVKSDFKGQGIGKQLMNLCVQWSRQNYPGTGLYLEVLADNHPAQAFYAALGATNKGIAFWQPPQGAPIKEYIYAWETIDDL